MVRRRLWLLEHDGTGAVHQDAIFEIPAHGEDAALDLPSQADEILHG